MHMSVQEPTEVREGVAYARAVVTNGYVLPQMSVSR